MKPMDIIVAGEKKKIWAQRMGNQIWCHYEGETFCYDIPIRGRRGGETKGHASPGVIQAPMPGKVIKVNYSVGDQVKEGDVIIVMEAMKMEYSLETDIAGVVQKINGQEGEQVAVGDELAVVAAKESLGTGNG